MTYGCGCNARIVEVKSGKRCETYEITESGTYLFKGDISFEPAAGGPDVCCVPPEPFTCGYVCPVGTVCGPSDDTSVVAIRIAASNVILDLAGFELSQGNNAQNVRGIQIERGLSNITVRNGIVRGFSQYGVRARGNTKDVEFHDLKVTKCGFNNVEVYRIFQAAMGGMALGESTYFDLGDHNLVLENVYMKNVKVVDNYFMGLILARSKNVNVQSSNFDDTYRNIAGLLTTNSDRIARYAYPLYLLGGGYDPDYMAEFVTFKNCSFNSARNDTPSSPAEANLELTGARCEVSNGHDIYFEDCEWRNYYCLAGRATAIDIDAVIGFSFTNCLFSDIVSDRSFAEGLHLSGTIDRFGCPRFDIGENAFFKVKDCTFRK